MTDHADLTARLRANATSLARRGINPLGSAVVSSARLRDAAAACTEAADALDAADAENARLTAERDEALAEVARLRDERRAVIDCLNLYGDEIIHDALDAIGFAPRAVSEEATDG